MNSISIIGNITADLETKTVGTTSVCEFSIAVNEVYYDAQKTKVEKVHFFNCSAWGKMGENIAQYFSKGQKIALVGSLAQDRWEKDGEKRSVVKIRVNTFDFCGDKKPQGEQDNSSPERRAPAKDPDLDQIDVDQDIPF